MTPDNDDEKRWRETAAVYLNVPWHAALDAKVTKLDTEGAEITFQTLPLHLTPHQTMHAGTVYLGLELANALASIPRVKPEETTMTVDTGCTLIATVRGEGQTVRLQAKMVKRTKRFGFFVGVALDDQGNILAKSRTTKAIVARRESKL